ncbi:MAG TPA: acyl-CoA desaturase [Verrucomicrobiales bacterium]|nr:acyl-CoA desaturase [Verrucomicrobiales bacterium]
MNAPVFISPPPGAHAVGRMHPDSRMTNPLRGKIVWSPVKSLWFTGHALVALAGGWLTAGVWPVAVCCALTVLTLCLGHTLGLHRLLIHRSFSCPIWVERVLVHLGVVVGMGGPFRMLLLHDIRDWAQRQPRSHPFYTNQAHWWLDWFWQMHCELRLENPPVFKIEPAVRNDPFLRFMERHWMLQQVPWAVLCHALAGVPGLVWGVSVRIVVSLTGHWLIGWLAHNVGRREWHMEGHSVQGFNLPRLGLLTMGECWHNNHHAFPGSARLGLAAGQHDPGWWALRMLMAAGLAWEAKTPATLPDRPERKRLPAAPKSRATTFFTL